MSVVCVINLKLEHLRILVSRTDANILVLTETWSKQSLDSVGRGDGVDVFMKTCLSVTVLNAVTVPKA